MPITIAKQAKDGADIAVPIVREVTKTIIDNSIDVMSVDPFVSSHRVTENDNNAIDAVAKTWAGIADATNSAIDLVHHVRKTGNAEITVEDGRGAVALLNASRSARVLNWMTEHERDNAGIIGSRRSYFRVEIGKSNLAPPPEAADWFHLTSVDLTNGDHVGVVTAWQWPNAFDNITPSDLRAAQHAVAAGGPWRKSVQADDWVGKPIATALKLDVTDKAHRHKISELLKVWIKNGMFIQTDERDPKRRTPHPCIKVGQLAGN